ncbi:MAG: DinB family protein [Dehalococcoidia bacterium]
MDKADLLDLFDYTEFAWRQLIDVTDDDAVLLRPAENSGWPTLRDCLGHIVRAYSRWVPAIVELKTGFMPEIADGDFRTWFALDEEHTQARTRLRQSIQAWTEDDLTKLNDVEVYGETRRYSRSELILHILLHERGHHGDVTTLFWQLGVEADAALEYRFYLGR